MLQRMKIKQINASQGVKLSSLSAFLWEGGENCSGLLMLLMLRDLSHVTFLSSEAGCTSHREDDLSRTDKSKKEAETFPTKYFVKGCKAHISLILLQFLVYGVYSISSAEQDSPCLFNKNS